MRDWWDARPGFRAAAKLPLDEPLPRGVGWWFVTGSIVLFLLSVQLLTGILLAIYYSPSPDHAYDSVRFIMERVTLGRGVRCLPFFGASFIVIAAVVHIVRVVAFGSYKKPRELNWGVGVLLLLIILAFALTGYLLPWDQKAYWATTVTLNIARSVPLAGNFVSGLLKGGTDLGALTLMRWYAAHVFLLPACLIVFTVAHIYLMRRHGISGPVKAVPGPMHPFYPYQAIRDTIAIAAGVGAERPGHRARRSARRRPAARTRDGRRRVQERTGAEGHHRRRVHGDDGAHVGVARSLLQRLPPRRGHRQGRVGVGRESEESAGAPDGVHGAGHQQGQFLGPPGRDLLDLSSSSADAARNAAAGSVLRRGHQRTGRRDLESRGRFEREPAA